MRTLRVVLTVVAVFVAGSPSVSGQEAPTLMVVADRHFKAPMSMANENCTLLATENCTRRGDTSPAERTFFR